MKFNNQFFLAIAGSVIALLISNAVVAQPPQQIVDADSDGLIEINSIYDLDTMRFDPRGKTFRGSSVGCPSTGCFGYELTRDLDFDTNGNGQLDSADYNQGQSWVPISSNADFYFEGNSHSIKNFFNNFPSIEGNVYSYGLFDSFTYAGNDGLTIRSNVLTVKNLRMINPKIIINGDGIITDARVEAGIIGGRLSYSTIENVIVENAVVSFKRSPALVLLSQPAIIGGIVAQMHDSNLENVSFSGEINVVDSAEPTPNGLARHTVGGIAARMIGSTVTSLNTHGKIIAPGITGGIFGVTHDVHIFEASSTIDLQLTGTYLSGGIVGYVISYYTSDILNSFENVYFTGKITGVGGGLVGLVNVPNTAFEIKNSYSNGIVTENGQTYAQLIRYVKPGGEVLNLNTYQVSDPEGVVLTAHPDAYNQAVNLGALQCASNPILLNCSEAKLVQFWNPDHWNFGSESELPKLIQASSYPWTSTDKPNSSGDHETITRVNQKTPQYACETPVDFQVKEKKSGYVFNAKTPDILDFFNVKQGLKCTNANQPDGICNNYEVSYLCGGSSITPQWTAYSNQDTSVNDGSDNESISASVCASGSPIGIRARTRGTTVDYYGSPQIPYKFSIEKGFTCRNQDNGGGANNNTCKDYEVRMLCNLNTRPMPVVNIEHLRDLADFPIGIAVCHSDCENFNILTNTSEQAVVEQHFNQVAAGNIMKMSYLQPTRGEFTFTEADAFVDYAKSKNMTVHGHTLIWAANYQVPDFMKVLQTINQNGVQVQIGWNGTTANFLKVLQKHVYTIVNHFEAKGNVISWDVVNEALDDNSPSNFRTDSPFYINSGNSAIYIEKVFQTARAADPDALLYYNDYKIEYNNSKTTKLIEMVTDFQNRGIPIDGIGFQMHVKMDSPSISDIRESFKKAVATGLKIKITELDIPINDHWSQLWPTNQIPTFTADAALVQKKRYCEVIKAYLDTVPEDQRGGITVWGVTDAATWLNKYGEKPNAWPLLFAENYNQKPALQGFADALQNVECTSL